MSGKGRRPHSSATKMARKRWNTTHRAAPRGLMDEIIHRLALFVSELWQIHMFGEGKNQAEKRLFFALFFPQIASQSAGAGNNFCKVISGS